VLLIRRLAQYVFDKDGGPWVHGAHHRCTDAGVIWLGIVCTVDGAQASCWHWHSLVDERARGVGGGGGSEAASDEEGHGKQGTSQL
jgi:hypothetical protein